MQGRLDAVLLDFDGPLCDVYAGLPATEVARRLTLVAQEVTGRRLPIEVESDPLLVLRIAADGGATQQELALIDSALRDLETEAIRSASPTNGAAALVEWLAQSHLRWAVVSNNSPEAIGAFFGRQGWPVPLVSGRVLGQPWT